MNDSLKMYGSIGLEIMNRYFVVAMCFKRQPRWRRLQTINSYLFYSILGETKYHLQKIMELRDRLVSAV